ncbi:unnamed protein product [Durusdinium trenchii]|uniref:DNA (cytosine-5-)-methyltransferase n=1 Tax=Durusdinium trenchii TaxID=1381693 RepID=A0ABP0L0E1_9DINO
MKVPEKVKSDNVKTTKLMSKPIVMQSFGSVRLYGATYRANIGYLSQRGKQDFGTQICYWDQYKRACRANKVKRNGQHRFVPPLLAEWIAGIPRDWTLPECGKVCRERYNELFPPVSEEAAYPVISMFSGIGGLELGLREVCFPIQYVEQNEHCVAVLRSRMFEKMIADGPVAEDVTTYIPSPSIKKRARGICAGFPCQDICQAGHCLGLQGERSYLVDHVFRVADECESVSFVFLENVAYLLSAAMSHVMDYVLQELTRRGLRVRWTTVTGHMVGVQVCRERVFLLATKGDFHFQNLTLMTSDEMESRALEPWNHRDRPELHCWLSTECTQQDQQRLQSVGNMVIPRCAQLALHVLEHSMRA